MPCYSCVAGRFDHPGPCEGACPFCGSGPDKPVRDGPFVQVRCISCRKLIEQRLVPSVQRKVAA